MRAIAIPLACMVAVACAPTVNLPPGEPPRGFTMCNGDVHYGYARIDALAGPEGESIIAHEAQHVGQMRLLGGCAEWDAFLKSKDNRARAEAGAYCVSAMVTTRQGLFPNLTEAVNHYGRQLANYKTLEIDADSARALIWRFCR